MAENSQRLLLALCSLKALWRLCFSVSGVLILGHIQTERLDTARYGYKPKRECFSSSSDRPQQSEAWDLIWMLWREWWLFPRKTRHGWNAADQPATQSTTALDKRSAHCRVPSSKQCLLKYFFSTTPISASMSFLLSTIQPLLHLSLGWISCISLSPRLGLGSFEWLDFFSPSLVGLPLKSISLPL